MEATVVRLSWFAVLVPFLAGGLVVRGPIGLAVRAGDAQLRITWDRHAAKKANLEILDGPEHAVMPVAAGLSSVTYQPRGADVEVRIASGETNLEIARCLGRMPLSVEVVRQEIQSTRAEARQLRAAVRDRIRRVEQMQRIANRMLEEVPESKPKPVRWWR